MIPIHIGRVYLRKNQVTSFHSSVGVNYWYMNQNIGQSPPHTMRGLLCSAPLDVTGFRMWYRPSSDSPDLQFKVWIIKQIRTHGSTSVVNQIHKSDIYQPKTLSSVELHFPVEGMAAEPGDLLSLGFERIGTAGTSTYLLYPDATTLETRDP